MSPPGSLPFLPTAAEHELLRAALLRDARAVAEAFARWKASVDFEALEAGSLRLMPMLYRNLQRCGVEDPLLPRVRGMYRRAWFRNEWNVRGGARVLGAFSEAGIPVLLIKGAALVATAYPEAALRPMDDIDVVVPRSQFRRAVDLLRALGWTTDPDADDVDALAAFQHAIAFRREGTVDVDLHWMPLFDMAPSTATDALWAAAVEAKFGGETVLVPAPPDALLLVCAHATLWSGVSPVRWVADAMAVLESAGDAFDWSRLVESAQRRSLSRGMAECLAYLREGLGAAIPAEGIARLRSCARPHERFVLRLRSSSRRVQRWYVLLLWVRLLFEDGVAAVPRRAGLLRRYLRISFRVPPGGSLLRAVAARILRPPVASAAPNRETTRP